MEFFEVLFFVFIPEEASSVIEKPGEKPFHLPSSL
jgi:hypothetical protein